MNYKGFEKVSDQELVQVSGGSDQLSARRCPVCGAESRDLQERRELFNGVQIEYVCTCCHHAFSCDEAGGLVDQGMYG